MTDEEIKTRNRPMSNDEIDFWLTTAEKLNEYGKEEVEFAKGSAGHEMKRDALIIAGVLQGISNSLNEAIAKAMERRKAASE